MKSTESSHRRGMLLSVSLASGAALLCALQAAAVPFFTAPHFTVQEIEVRWPAEMKRPTEHYRLSRPTSIFQVDLTAVAQALQKTHPGVAVDAVRRILPDRLVAMLRPLKVIAQIRTDCYYPVSREGIVVGVGQTARWTGLPLLSPEGIRRPYRVGEIVNYPGFWQSSELLSAIQRQGGLAGHHVAGIRSRSEEFSVFLDNGLEIRWASERLWPAWQQLTDLLAQKPDLIETSRYLDLRFDDPIIGRQSRAKK